MPGAGTARASSRWLSRLVCVDLGHADALVRGRAERRGGGTLAIRVSSGLPLRAFCLLFGASRTLRFAHSHLIAAMRAGGHDVAGREALLKYVLRPAVAQESAVAARWEMSRDDSYDHATR